MAKLDSYRRKRDFAVTGEPRGAQAKQRGDRFVIQKHAARRLHYDLRLELDGVYKSWAVTRGPSLIPGEKRLAVEVEDHPLDYGTFEGTIPKGQYGGGTVIVWDRGHWRPDGDARRGLAKGHLDFTLEGEKLQGHWHLVRMRDRRGEKRHNWLLIKAEDEAARGGKAPDILEERPESVKTGRSIAEVAEEAGDAAPKRKPRARKAARPADPPSAADLPARAPEAPLPGFVEPCLATLKPRTPTGEQWLHEIKFDGYRLQARIEKGKARLLTRTGLDWSGRFGKDLRAQLAALPLRTALIDGEVVVETDGGASDFSALQADLAAGRSDRFLFYAFDLLHLDGRDLRPLRLEQRKEALRLLLADLPAGSRLRYSEHFDVDGAVMIQHACRLSLEGLVSKRRDRPYRSGRGGDWIKSKCSHRQEFVVGGYVPSSTSAKAIGSLVMGYYDKGKLRHAGRVGTGYSVAVAQALRRRLDKLRGDDSPFAGRLTATEGRDVRFVRPELVAEVDFRGWTADRHLRHAAFRGLREDKAATEVVREETAPAQSGAVKPPAARSGVKLTHPDRVYWPEQGVTKEGLASYYGEVWRRMAPFVVARPLALLRCPDGISKACFFQKHAWRGIGKAIRLVADPADPQGEKLLSIADFDGLVALVQAGTLEIHPWGATLASIERPDLVTFDLDPGEGVTWRAVIDAALEVRQRLQALGLAAFVKTSGGKGLHVVAPLKPKADWVRAKAFCKALAEAMARDDREHYVATATKAKRHGRIFVDYLRNGRGATAVAPYSTRARAGAAVSMPLAWEELSEEIGPAYFTVENAPVRIANTPDPWADFRAAAVPLPAAKAE